MKGAVGGGPYQVVLVSNGPGELYTWVRPVLDALRRRDPLVRVAISLVPCQFAGGNEAAIARTFAPDLVTTPAQYLRAAAVGAAPEGLSAEPGRGVVIGLGGNAALTVALGRRLGHPAYRYSFEPHWQRGLTALLVPDERVRTRAVRAGAPAGAVRVVGNLVADAVDEATPAASPGSPHVLLFAGSRDAFAVHLIPLLIAVVDRLRAALPGARFVWPVSRLLRPDTIAAGVAGRHAATLGGVAGSLVDDGPTRAVITPGGGRLELVPEEERYAHMRAADLALTIPGTNTLELGIAGVPSLVLLPLNQPELIPLEGAGHWLGLVPLVGKYLKRHAVRMFVNGLKVPVSLPNRLSGEELMVELSGHVDPARVAEAVLRLLADPTDLAARRSRLHATMPRRGAAAALLDAVLPAASGRARAGGGATLPTAAAGSGRK